MKRLAAAAALCLTLSGCFSGNKDMLVAIEAPRTCPLTDGVTYELSERTDDAAPITHGRAVFGSSEGACFLTAASDLDKAGSDLIGWVNDGTHKQLSTGIFVGYIASEERNATGEIGLGFSRLAPGGVLETFSNCTAGQEVSTMKNIPGLGDGKDRECVIVSEAGLRSVAANLALAKVSYRLTPVR